MQQSSFWDSGIEFSDNGVRAGNEFDVCIVGAGIVGASTAIEIKQRRPELRVCIVDRTGGPMGATTRNAGFACFGSLSEIAHDIDLLGADTVVDLVRRRWKGLQLLRSRCGDTNISYEDSGGHEIFLGNHPSLYRIEEINSLLEPIFGGPAFQRRDDLIKTYGMNYDPRNTEERDANSSFRGVHALVRTEYEGMLHSGMLVHRLWTIARELDVEIITSDVVGMQPMHNAALDVQRKESRYIARFINGNSLVCKNVVVATNARIKETVSLLLTYSEKPEIHDKKLPHMSGSLTHNALIPARGQILVTSPLTNLRLRGTFHYNEGFVYFRNVGNRILLGGGRNLALSEEQTLSMDTTSTIQNYLENMLFDVILPGERVNIEYRWAGTMAFNESKMPVVEEMIPNVFTVFGCNGMGVAIGSEVAKRAAELIENRLLN